MITKNRTTFLSIFSTKVKAILTLCVIFFHFSMIVAKNKPKIITLGIGEQYEIPLSQINKLSLGNREVIKLKKLKNSVMIKGLKMGYSDLMIWNNQKHYFHLYVYSKRNQLKQVHLQKDLESINIKLEQKGHFKLISGTLNDINSYRLFHHIINDIDTLHNQVKLSANLKKLLITQALQALTTPHQIPYCTEVSAKINCYIPLHFPNKSFIKIFEKQYQIKIILSKRIQSNYKATLYLAQVQKDHSISINLGTNYLKTLIDQWTHQSEVKLSNSNLNTYFLASPSLYLKANHESEISLGEETSYQYYQEGKQQTAWKFSGLKVKLQLKPFNDKIQISHKVQLKLPNLEDTKKFSQYSVLDAKLNTPSVLFKLDLNEILKKNSSFPFLNHIPFFHHLFRSKEQIKRDTQLIGIINLTRIN